jgi:hypothetical protein
MSIAYGLGTHLSQSETATAGERVAAHSEGIEERLAVALAIIAGLLDAWDIHLPYLLIIHEWEYDASRRSNRARQC